jgi:hypothetical protein
MSIATCLAYCSGVSPNLFAICTCVLVKVTLFGAVLRVAGATTEAFRFGSGIPLFRVLELTGEHLTHTSIDALVVSITLRTYALVNELIMQPQRKARHLIIGLEPWIFSLPIHGPLVDFWCWSGFCVNLYRCFGLL